MRSRIAEVLIVAMSCVIGIVFVEAGYRLWFLWRYAVEANYSVVTVDQDMRDRGFARPGSVFGPNPISTIVRHAMYWPDGSMAADWKVRFNNLGWVSHFDYRRDKAPGEFRIAVIGDSMTASVNNEKPWPDELQRVLDADPSFKALVGASSIRVLNLGIAGASLQLMAGPLAAAARRFGADLVVVNPIIEDLARRHTGAFDDKADPAPVEAPVSDEPPPVAPHAFDYFIVDGVRVHLLCLEGKDAACTTSPLWEVQGGRTFSAAELNSLKRRIAIIALWRTKLSSLRLLSVQAALERLSPAAARADDAPAQPVSRREIEDIEIGIRALRWIERQHPGSLRTLNPLLWYFNPATRPALIDHFRTAAEPTGMTLLELTDRMPIQLGEREWRLWYNAPYDFHWSDHGAPIFARAMAEAIVQHEAGKRGLPREPNVCDSAYRGFLEGQAAWRKRDVEAALARLQQADAALPPSAVELAKLPATMYRHCGFLRDFLGLAAEAHRVSGRLAEAFALEERALAINSDPFEYAEFLVVRAQAVRSNNDTNGALALLGRALAANPDHRVALKLNAEILADDHPERAFDLFSRLLADAPKPERTDLLFRRARTASSLTRFDIVIADMSELIAADAQNPDLRFFRGNALYQVGRYAEALQDFDAALKAKPGHEPFLQARESAVVAVRWQKKTQRPFWQFW